MFDAFLNKMQTFMKQAGAACLVLMALITCLDVAGRGFFNKPIFGSEELVAILAVLAIGLALPSAHAERSHIGVELFVRLLPRRARRAIRLCTESLALALFGLVAWRMWDYAGTIRDSGEVSMNLELPTYYVIYALSACFLAFMLMILGDITALIRNRKVD
ncbi:MAG: TRAP transporter small permease [Desulfovibrionaceae bacterium]